MSKSCLTVEVVAFHQDAEGDVDGGAAREGHGELLVALLNAALPVRVNFKDCL